MNSSMIGKIEKAHRYAGEASRIQLGEFKASFRGEHDSYNVAFDGGHWSCSCHTFEAHMVGTCAHVMAMQLILGDMLSAEARFATDEAPVAR
ncbi:MAG: hypothetical protein ACR2OO_13490 [Thermomicrobiales bacterium]